MLTIKQYRLIFFIKKKIENRNAWIQTMFVFQR